MLLLSNTVLRLKLVLLKHGWVIRLAETRLGHHLYNA